MQDHVLEISRNLAELSEEQPDTFLYTSYRKKNSLETKRQEEWAQHENVLLTASPKKPIRRTQRYNLVESLTKKYELPRLSVDNASASDVFPKRAQMHLAIQSFYQSRLRPAEINLSLPRDPRHVERLEEARVNLSVEKMISNNSLRRRYRRQQQKRQNMDNNSNFKSVRGNARNLELQLGASMKPISSRESDMETKLAEFRKLMRLKHQRRMDVEDFINYDFPKNY